MLFSSTIFLFLFLPAVLLGHLLLPRALRNLFLLLVSLFFYAWGETIYTAIMLVSITGNYFLTRLMAGAEKRVRKKAILIMAIVLNLGLLCWFKYANFLMGNVNALLQALGGSAIAFEPVHLPLGISFFTFQALSYVVDVYQGKVAVQKRFVNLALYISLFPQLIAGPIVRYRHIAEEIIRREIKLAPFAYGIRRFIIGLAKKMIIANPMGEVADTIFTMPPGEWSLPLSWLGAACFAIQLYYDFSGYSDMAIGLGRMLGFTFRENFNYPYIARSFREYWQRWHISLSLWFRDYLYIPLGGNRCSGLRTQLNLWCVFTLVGLWHGASWNFVVFGALHGFFMVLERAGLDGLLQRLGRPFGHAYFIVLYLLCFGVFCTRNMSEAVIYLANMTGLNGTGLGDGAWHFITLQLFPLEKQVLFLIGCVLAVPWQGLPPRIWERMRPYLPSAAVEGIAPVRPWLATVYQMTQFIVLFGLFSLSIMHVAAGTYNPFIYFRF
ncbi:MAG: MBOAT family O-acyltransferase [Desulfobacterales bacterium]|jgi:alginate O-acetyltransferase complex protein AlgI